MKASTKEWFSAANDDFETVKILMENSNLTNIVTFHLQQAIEKTLKAFFEEYELGFIKTHNLQTLLAMVEDQLKLEYDEQVIGEIDQLYIDSRYPGDIGLLPNGNPSMNDISKYHKLALSIFDQVNRHINR
ncbi:MAG TPA: HEPN domain-containing protein [Prolixibacteraceae bacterium]|nr:HEPN domain-containing protein [Prolixibacteraceae bacterium]